MTKRTFLLLSLLFILQSCLVSRTRRPKVSGYVFDKESKKPIYGCKVETFFTDLAIMN